MENAFGKQLHSTNEGGVTIWSQGMLSHANVQMLSRDFGHFQRQAPNIYSVFSMPMMSPADINLLFSAYNDCFSHEERQLAVAKNKSAKQKPRRVKDLPTEMSMPIVMPAILPHTQVELCMCMARLETAYSGNPHFHGFSIGAGGPRLGRVDADMDREVLGDLAPGSDDEDGDDVTAQGLQEGLAFANLDESATGADKAQRFLHFHPATGHVFSQCTSPHRRVDSRASLSPAFGELFFHW